MKAAVKKTVRHQRRKRHIRKTVSGVPHRPRLTVFRSHNNIYAQIIDDTAGRTLVAASSLEESIGKAVPTGGNRQAARVVGSALAAKAAKAGIKKVIFDRSGYAFHGRVKELAAAARDACAFFYCNKLPFRNFFYKIIDNLRCSYKYFPTSKAFFTLFWSINNFW